MVAHGTPLAWLREGVRIARESGDRAAQVDFGDPGVEFAGHPDRLTQRGLGDALLALEGAVAPAPDSTSGEAAPPVTVRAAGEGDLPAVLALYVELHSQDPRPSPAAAFEVWRRILAEPNRTVLVAEVEGVVVATVDCLIVANLTRGQRPYLLIENVVVAAAHRRRGIGAQILEAAAELARSAGCYKAQLVAGDGADVRAFYLSCGFTAVARGFKRYLAEVP